MENAEKIAVEVAYALPERQLLVNVDVVPEATLEEAILASGILDRCPEIDLSRNKVGVFGKLGKLSDTLHADDRVEIYRPLIADPKEVRKKRAAEGKIMKKGAGS
jgi:putative ubiquitin-RnfH superfamily antitoxin RatB of RatAB toxin-antitoxin module